MPSQVTSQVWPSNEQFTSQVWPWNKQKEYRESTSTVNGVLLKDIDPIFPDLHIGVEGVKHAYVWTFNRINPVDGSISHGSFTTCATATENTKADNDKYISMANEVGEAVRDALRDTESEWAPECRTGWNVQAMKRAETAAFDAFVQSDPERYSHVGLSEARKITMFNVERYFATMDDSSHRETVAGMVLVKDDDVSDSEFLSQKPHLEAEI
ncbi:hypothetical protein B9479_007426 [Cryptococcus floricola]|uniref:Uncharacterized protein n=1 Tax=Cryptococcus floricola TaxID=2591691 RepID=A0A5D3APC0_9TREE|nr:hypothetical protein B9479_007426 [Cryptococcus floricola]